MVSLRRLRELGIGHSVNWVMSEGFDYLLYPAVIWKLGPLLGGAIMSVASLLVCLGCLCFYDWSKRDWLGIEAIKDLESVQSFRRKQKARARVPSAGGVSAFLLLSLYFDPFITTAYLRRGRFNGMKRRDWVVFLGSWFISNIGWILVITGGMCVLRDFIATFV